MEEKCFCHLNGYAVKDATARAEIETIKTTYATKEEVTEAVSNVSVDLSDYATTTYVDESITNKHEFVLFNNEEGVSGDITLSDSVANYSYIEIYFTDNGEYDHGCEKFYNINGKNFCLEVSKAWLGAASGKVQSEFRSVNCTANDNQITISNYGYIQTNGAEISLVKHENYILITRVVGYK